jgi:hypothetical protein
MIVETENAKAFRREKLIAPCIAVHICVFEMLAAVQFNNEIGGVTQKIRNIRPNRRLPPEDGAVEPMSAKGIPDNSLCVC